jgi:hypothetical protein
MQQQSLSQSSGRVPASRFVSFLFAALSFLSVGMLTSACGNGGTGGSGGSGGGTGGAGGSTGAGDCIGGVVVNGVCEGKCTPDKCIEGNTCVGNRCMLKCDSHKDCYPDGSQSCVPAKEDDTAADISVCQFTGKSAGVGTSCPFGPECANWLSCPDGGTCFASQCAGDTAACVLDDVACKDVENCIFGKCPDGSGCRADCATNCKPWLECDTKGEADADAYCTQRDCVSDDECLGGYYCGIVRDPHEICGSDPPKGDNNLCGSTLEPCKTPGQDGTSLFEGSLCMLRKSCIKRAQGAPCTTDLDCSLIDSQKCVAFGGETHCSNKCGIEGDCLSDADCDAGLGACVPKFGAWKGTGGKFCEPCLSDEDCGAKGTSWACAELSGGARACFDESFPDTCTKDSDCPKAPGGKAGTCFDEGEGFSAADNLYHRCYLPLNPSDNKTSCW